MYLPDTVFSVFFIFATGVDTLWLGEILEAILGGFTDEDGCLDPFPLLSFLSGCLHLFPPLSDILGGCLDPFPPLSDVLGGCLDPFLSPSLPTYKYII